MKKRTITLLVCLLLGAASITLIVRSNSKAPEQIRTEPSINDVAQTTPATTTGTPERKRRISKPHNWTVQVADRSAAIVFANWLSQLKGVQLTPEQFKALTQIYSEVAEARSEFEAEIAVVTKVSEKEHLIEIPAYASIGRNFEADLFQRIEKTVGSSLSKPIRAQLEERVRAQNRGWGSAAQDILVTHQEPENVYRVVHRILPIVDPLTGRTSGTATFISLLTPDLVETSEYGMQKALFPRS